MTRKQKTGATRRAADLTVAQLRKLITESVKAESDDLFTAVATVVTTELERQLQHFRTLMVTANPYCTDNWANKWVDVAGHLVETLRDGLRAANAPASASDIARELAKHSDSQLNWLLWQNWPTKELAAIRAAAHKQLGLLDHSPTHLPVGDGSSAHLVWFTPSERGESAAGADRGEPDTTIDLHGMLTAQHRRSHEHDDQ